MLDEVKNLVDVSRTLLDTLPKNSIKNKQKFESVLDEQKQVFEKYKSELEKEISKRFKKITNLAEETFEDKISQIVFMKENLHLLNKYNSSYEKLNLDKILYKLNHFYKDDLDDVNSNIIECINIFKCVGVYLESKDFDYSPYASEYMNALLNENDSIKEVFEQIYWQCPDLFIHIELNFKYLYYLYQKNFDKYVENKKNDFIKMYSSVDIIETYKNLIIDYEYGVSTSLKLGLDKFLNRSLNINDYSESRVMKCYSFFTDDMVSDKITDDIIKMSYSVKEYQEYMYFKEIVDDIRKIYSDKDKYKDNLKNKFRQIQKKEKIIRSYSKKKNKINTKLVGLINELDSLYAEISMDKFLNELYKNINDESSIYDVLCLAASYYSYIVKYMKEYKKDGDFVLEQQRLIDFLLNPYNNILKNISIIDDKNIPLIICDRYKLSNFHINKEILESNSGIEELINNSCIIEVYNKIVLKLSYDDIKFAIDVKDLLNK